MTDPLSLVSEPLAEAVAALTGDGPADVALERPADETRGDLATTVAMRLAKALRRPPREIAEELGQRAVDSPWVERAEVAGPGFLNLWLTPAWYAEAVRAALGEGYGGGTAAPPERINVEYVSANPTGRLTVGSARNAAYGDSLARLLEHAGHDVVREYYFNDAGRQVETFARSLRARARGEDVPEDGYPGEDVAQLARRLDLPDDASLDDWARAGVEAMFAEIRDTLTRFRCRFDVWTNEAQFHEADEVDAALARAAEAGHTFEADGALWLRTSEFGDDKDRPLLRSETRQPTYLAADLAYIIDKLGRGFERAIYVLGADHHGYVRRLKAAAAALGFDPDRIEIPLYQLVSIVEGGEQRKISKRRGDIVLLDDLVEAIGVDASRFFLVQRSHDQTIEIDLELAREQGPKNPVYYVQYGHARIASMLRKADVDAFDMPDLAALPEGPEAALIRRLADFPTVCAVATELRAPHRIVDYAYRLASDFHVFYTECPVLKAEEPVRQARIALSEATRRVLARALDLIGVAAPDAM